MRLIKNKDGEEVHDSNFFDAIDQYQETGLFVFLAEAFLICRQKGHPLPDEVLVPLTEHFTKFVDADEKKDGLAALGFDNNSDGGAWQGKAARANKFQILLLMDDIDLLASNKKDEKFQWVASVCGTTAGNVKKLYYEAKRKKR